MGTQRAHVVLPKELISEIDARVGARGRSAFLVKVAQAELRRQRLLEILTDEEPIWKLENHPELAEGASKWVRAMRDQGDERITKAFDRREG